MKKWVENEVMRFRCTQNGPPCIEFKLKKNTKSLTETCLYLIQRGNCHHNEKLRRE